MVPREHAPRGRVLPYRRAAGENPPAPGPGAADVANRGWSLDLGDRGLGDLLMGLAAARALQQASDLAGRHAEPVYRGRRPRLLERCHLPVSTKSGSEGNISEGNIIATTAPRPVRLRVVPDEPPIWLDERGDASVEAHAALPMRYYLELEQALGVRLPAPDAPLPAFGARSPAPSPFHVVFVTATSWPQRKDYGLAGFGRIAARLTERVSGDWRFTIITPPGDAPVTPRTFGLPCSGLAGPDAVDCLDIFGDAQLVIGNDTGLTHLAALSTRPDGTRPDVVSLYGRHGHTKWTTGSDRHHAVATPFSHMMSAADACPVRDRIDDAAWGSAADIAALPPGLIADFAGACVGWW